MPTFLCRKTVSSFLPSNPPAKIQASDCWENKYMNIPSRSCFHHFGAKVSFGPWFSLGIEAIKQHELSPVLSGLIAGLKNPFIMTKIRSVRYWTDFKTRNNVNRTWSPSVICIYIKVSFMHLS